MTNSTKTQDSFESCYSCIFENSQDSQVDSLQETLNNKVFLLPCSYNDIWLVNQLNELKLISQNDDQLNKLNKYDDTCSDNEEPISSEDNSVIQEEILSDYTNYCNFSPNESVSSTRLSDIIKNKLLSVKNSSNHLKNNNNNNNNNTMINNSSFQNQNFFSEEDTILIDELVKDLSIHSTSSSFSYNASSSTSYYTNINTNRNANSNTSSSSNLTSNVQSCTNYFTQDEIDGIKEILSQEC
ncbi:hypothetical protein cpbgf_500253 [Cryptosporidium parvum]|uniref:Uncharacterized protein n=1 Tax=Cryptosporidium parvum TaxID=5807 RepID=A0A7S7LHP5_CRYPV|nr:hypothetical protein CPATCC_0022060 [Cryptosporidium parvum]WKS77681.1 hypothetical protein CPCDC_5g255 [Cryptosporidium sp. 43IA8]WRK32172.1 hypothetical protein cpbgf_500253 [Cryptosporidium parvum]|eukprot:QOY41461.1 hypothetical protein CPATCC_002017 [Cryptosporidium parvum]